MTDTLKISYYTSTLKLNIATYAMMFVNFSQYVTLKIAVH